MLYARAGSKYTNFRAGQRAAKPSPSPLRRRLVLQLATGGATKACLWLEPFSKPSVRLSHRSRDRDSLSVAITTIHQTRRQPASQSGVVVYRARGGAHSSCEPIRAPLGCERCRAVRPPTVRCPLWPVAALRRIAGSLSGRYTVANEVCEQSSCCHTKAHHREEDVCVRRSLLGQGTHAAAAALVFNRCRARLGESEWLKLQIVGSLGSGAVWRSHVVPHVSD